MHIMEFGSIRVSDVKIDLGRLIKKMRTDRKLSQEELANKMSITIDIIKNIEKGTEKYNVIFVNKFKRCFGYFEW